MRFVHPEILWALTALAVPVLIHLFNFRRYKKIAFSNVSFLKEVKSETTKSSKIRHLIILICRLLAFAALIFAFAQPFFPTGVSEKMNEWYDLNKIPLNEDLAVWFGKKKKPKGSSQPKGPWVDICRKVDGKHPPCGRSDTSKGSYP